MKSEQATYRLRMTGHPQIRAEATIQLLFPYASLQLFAESAKAELQWEGRKARG